MKVIRLLSDILRSMEERFCDWVEDVTFQKELRNCTGCKFLSEDKDGFRKCMELDRPLWCIENGLMLKEPKDG